MAKDEVKWRGVLKRLRKDKDGVVAFEYVITAACVVAAVAAAFGTGGAGNLADALIAAVTAITTTITNAV